MALGANTIGEIRTTGNDTNNAGLFDPGQTAGMFTDGTTTANTGNTTAPVFKSASYNFVAGDINAWVYIATGSQGGWYQITSVASNQATLNGTIAAGVLRTSMGPTTAVGISSSATPTNLTWTIDYSQQASAQFTYTDLASVGAGLTVSSTGKPFAKQQVGNSIVVTSGTNFNTGRWVIASVAAGVATLVGSGNITTGAGLNGNGGQGGAFASLGQFGAVKVASNKAFIISGTYSITSASANVAAGVYSDTTGGTSSTNISKIQGYGTVRGDNGTAPLLQAGNAIATFSVIAFSSAGSAADNITVDCATLTASTAFSITAGSRSGFLRCTAKNFTANGFINSSYELMVWNCAATGGTSAATASFNFGSFGGSGMDCVAQGNACVDYTCTGGSVLWVLIRCISDSCSGAAIDGFVFSSRSAFLSNCVVYNPGRHGFNIGGSGVTILENCIAEGTNVASSVGFNSTVGVQQNVWLVNCGAYNWGSSNVNATNLTNPTSLFATLTASPFVSASGHNFALNNTASAGAACRGAGFPGTLPLGSIGTIDIGALQHADPTATTNIFPIFD